MAPQYGRAGAVKKCYNSESASSSAVRVIPVHIEFKCTATVLAGCEIIECHECRRIPVCIECECRVRAHRRALLALPALAAMPR